MATKQVWKCNFCGYTYNSPVYITGVVCPKLHTKGRNRGRWWMVLVEGRESRHLPAGRSKVK